MNFPLIWHWVERNTQDFPAICSVIQICDNQLTVLPIALNHSGKMEKSHHNESKTLRSYVSYVGESTLVKNTCFDLNIQ
jgi:hypothetical protein